MKHIFLIGLITLSFFLVSCSKTTLVGKWRDSEITNGGFLEFTSDGHFIFYNKGIQPRRGTYTTDDSKSPKYLDLTYSANNVTLDGNRIGKSDLDVGIYKFEEDTLVIKSANQMEDNIHPSDFSNSEGYITMHYKRFDGSIPTEYQVVYESPRQIEERMKNSR